MGDHKYKAAGSLFGPLGFLAGAYFDKRGNRSHGKKKVEPTKEEILAKNKQSAATAQQSSNLMKAVGLNKNMNNSFNALVENKKRY